MMPATSRERVVWLLALAFAVVFTTAGAKHLSQDPLPSSPQPSGGVASPAAAAAPTREPPIEVAAPDLNKGVWVHGPNLPSPRQNASAAVIAGRIYLIGGFGPRNEQMDTTLVWEPQVAGSPRGEAERAGMRLGSIMPH